MRHQLKPTSFAERQSRSLEKQALILDFLAGGEQWTLTPLAARVMGVSPRAAARTLALLEREGALKRDELQVPTPGGYVKSTIWGVSGHGQALADRWDCAEYTRGQISPGFAMHHIQSQQARLAAQAAGWRDWQPGKALYDKGFKKIPDALVTSPDGLRVAVEIERSVKTPKRYAEGMAGAIIDIRQKKFDVVHYISPDSKQHLIERAQAKVTILHFKGEVIPTPVEEKHRRRFRFFSLDAWPPK